MTTIMPDKKLRAGFVQFLKFNIVGLLNTLVDFAVFTLLHSFGMAYGLAQVISYSAGTANSFVLNKKITFRDRSNAASGFDRAQLLKFIVLNLIVMGISLLLLHLFTDIWGFQVLISKVLATCVTVFLNFFASRKWVF